MFLFICSFKLCLGGIVLTASHNPGGIKNDFGIKFNVENGGPAPDAMTDAIFNQTVEITEYKFTPELDCDISKIGTQHFEVRQNIITTILSCDFFTFDCLGFATLLTKLLFVVFHKILYVINVKIVCI